MTKPVVRFAPSPTGLLHVGNARMALLNALFCAKEGGQFILRLDDTDKERSTEEFSEAIEQDLAWMGLAWDRVVRQSDNFENYDNAFARLRDAGKIYPCYETPEELEYKRKRQLSQGKPPIYDRSSLNLSDAQRQAFEDEGRSPHWRFCLDHEDISWDDLVRGSVHFNGANLSDPVLMRGDGSYLYMLPSAVDDVDCAITHVIRGEDHVANTAAQIQIFQALGADAPRFAHFPLLVDHSGQGLSKRLGSLSLESLRQDGIEAAALCFFLASLGRGDADVDGRFDFDALAEDFDITRYGRSAARFDMERLCALNAKVLHATPFSKFSERFEALGIDLEAGPEFWEAVRPNLDTFEDVRLWAKVCFEEISSVVDDREFIDQAKKLLPPEPWDQTTWGAWTKEVKQETGRKGKDLFLPLRLALTGLEHGPELKALLPIIGRARIVARLS
jgi:glutamyl-tRNA synthetase